MLDKNEKAEIATNVIQSYEYAQAQENVDYWKSVGAAILDESLIEKWNNFVDKRVNSYLKGSHLNEILQIISMIKANIPYEKIAQVLSKVSGGDGVSIIWDLESFVSSDVLNEIQSQDSHSLK